MGYSRPRLYCLSGMATTGLNPLDSTTYYLGGSQANIQVTATSRQTPIPVSGRIRSAILNIFSSTTGTNEDWTWSLYDGTTTTAIQTLGAATASRTWINNTLDYPVTAGGYVQLKTTTPAWVTNPEGCTAYYALVIETG